MVAVGLVLTGGTGGGTTVTESPAPVDPSAPLEPSTTVEPSTPVDPSAPVPPPTVELPPSVEGQDASQQTCTAGQTAGG